MTNRLKTISSRLFVTNVGVQRGISSSSCKILPVFERNMLTVTGFVTLSEAEINDVDHVLGSLSSSGHEIVGFDVPMNDPFFVDNLDSLEHLNRNVEDS